jgi:hypothetical protein
MKSRSIVPLVFSLLVTSPSTEVLAQKSGSIDLYIAESTTETQQALSWQEIVDKASSPYEDKQAWINYFNVDRFFLSSKTYNNCLSQIDRLSLDVRIWQFPKFQKVHDTDINAAVNIRDEGLRILAAEHLATASGQRVRLSKGTAFRGNVG